MRKAEEIPQIVKHPFPHVIVKDFLDTATLDLVIDALASCIQSNVLYILKAADLPAS